MFNVVEKPLSSLDPSADFFLRSICQFQDVPLLKSFLALIVYMLSLVARLCLEDKLSLGDVDSGTSLVPASFVPKERVMSPIQLERSSHSRLIC